MKFTEFEIIMGKNGVHSLAEIARALETTPQAVSNWKARDHVPYHIEAKIRKSNINNNDDNRYPVFTEDSIKIIDILLTVASQLKIVLIVPFAFVFISFTYIQFIQENEYQSSAKILIAGGDQNQGSLGGIAGLANQFGVNLPSQGSGQTDLSNPYLLPDLLVSRTFAEKVLVKEFYSKKYQKTLPLYKLLTHGDAKSSIEFDNLITKAAGTLNREYIDYRSDPLSPFSLIKVTAPEPELAKKIADVVIIELEALNRFFKSQHVRDKTGFIEERISSVEAELEASEKKLKTFNEQNRQIISPSLQLELDRLTRDVEVQEGIYLTLKQQLELAKIEVIQESSVINILDNPQVPLGPTSKNLVLRVLMSFAFGVVIALLIAFSRTYANTNSVEDRKKLLRTKFVLRKKIKDFFFDSRVSGIISTLLISGLPFYLGYQSKSPVFFGRYSTTLMLIISIYLIILIIFSSLFLFQTYKKRATSNKKYQAF